MQLTCMPAIPAMNNPSPQTDAPATAPEFAASTPAFSPLYQQIKGLILQSLQSSEWKPGESIPSEMELAARYRTFAQRCMVQAQGIYQGFVEAGILLMEPAQVEALTLNSWIIMTSWVRFLCTTFGSHGDLSQDMLRRGIYQVLALEGGYASAEARPAIEALQQKLFVPVDALS